MKDLFLKMLADVAGRPARRWGIRTASDYVKGLTEGRIAGSLSDERWAQELKQAEGKLVYASSRCHVLKAKRYEMERTEKALLDFAAVLTTNREDRDRDVLEPAGARLDVRMPLLWQHLTAEPIGSFRKALDHSKEKLVCQWCVADTGLGRDVAELLAVDALRMSHGFVPLEWEPRPNKDGTSSYHVKSYDVFEGSLVSVPSNVDAEVLALSRNKLFHPLTVARAKAIKDRMPATVVSGFVPPAAPVPETKNTPAPAETAAATPAPVMPTPAPEVMKNKPLAGSWEAVYQELAEDLPHALMLGGLDFREHDSAWIFAMFPGYAVVCVTYARDHADVKHYRMTWGTAADGEAEWTGEPEEVEVVTEIRDKTAKIFETMIRNLSAERLGDMFAARVMDDPGAVSLTCAEQVKEAAGKAVAANVQKQEYTALEAVLTGLYR